LPSGHEKFSVVVTLWMFPGLSAMAMQHTWSTGTAEVATRAGKFA